MQTREDKPEKKTKVDRFGAYLSRSTYDAQKADRLVQYARAIELGRCVARDIGGADPERMAPPRVAEYMENLFGNSTTIKVKRYGSYDI